jgi:hypothetical protein
MFVGTQLDNMRDCFSKGRGQDLRGEEKYCAVLTEKDVIEIRLSKEITRDLAKRYGVNKASITSCRLGNTWKHLNEKYPPLKFFDILTNEQRFTAFHDKRPIMEIARDYGVAYQSIWQLKRRGLKPRGRPPKHR